MVLVNGELGPLLAVTDRGFNYGDGLFTTLCCRAGQPLLWPLHVARLTQGCARLGFAMVDDGLLLAELQSLAAGSDCIIKIILTRGSGGRGYGCSGVLGPNRVVSCHPLPAQRQQWREQGLRLATLSGRLGSQPLLAGLKSLNRLEQVLLRREVAALAVDEGLCLDAEGYLVEATAANLWWRQGERWFTPELSHCGVAGVMRQRLLQLFAEQGVSVDCLRPVRALLDDADEIALSNCTFGLVPVRELDGRLLPPAHATRQLQQQLAEVMI